MPLVPAKCVNCGASLTLDEATVGSTVECPFCHTSLIFERQPDNTFVTNYKIAHADTVIVEDSKSVEKRLTNAQTYLDAHRDYATAERHFSELVDDASNEWRAWWGLARSITHDFTLVQLTSGRFSQAERAAEGALTVSPEEMNRSLTSSWNSYVVKYRSYHADTERRLADVQQRMTSNSSRRSAAMSELSELSSQLQQLEKQERKAQSDAASAKVSSVAPLGSGCLWVVVGLMVLAVILPGAMPEGDTTASTILFIIALAVGAWFVLNRMSAKKSESQAASTGQQIASLRERIAAQQNIISQCDSTAQSLNREQSEVQSLL